MVGSNVIVAVSHCCVLRTCVFEAGSCLETSGDSCGSSNNSSATAKVANTTSHLCSRMMQCISIEKQQIELLFTHLGSPGKILSASHISVHAPTLPGGFSASIPRFRASNGIDFKGANF